MVFDALPYGNEITAVAIVVIAIAAARLVNALLGRYAHRLAGRTSTSLDDTILAAVHRPLFLGIVLTGLLLAMRFITLLAPYAGQIQTGFAVLFTLYGVWFVSRIANAIIAWYASEVAGRTATGKDDQFLPIIRKAVIIIFGFIALLMVLGQFGIEITTLVAALGIGGLALALALQPTLSNFFSGAHIILDTKGIKIGDFIELAGGPSGDVVDIGWRSTKVQTPSNNTVIIPNAKLAESIVTNYSSPTLEIGFAVRCGVGYGSDLDRVERVTLEVARQVMKKTGHTFPDFEPLVRFDEFGDSNIGFNAILRAKDRGSTFLLKHEFIKALKKRYDREGIEISWPVRKVHHATDPSPVRGKRKRKQ